MLEPSGRDQESRASASDPGSFDLSRSSLPNPGTGKNFRFPFEGGTRHPHQAINEETPAFAPTSYHRFVVDELRSIASALHPDALVQNPMSSADQAKARERFLVHVVQALSNLKQNPQDKAVSTKEPNGVSEAQAPDSNKLHLEQTGELRESLWIVKCAFLHARENESLVRGMFAACTKDPEFFLNTLLDDSIFKNTLWVAYILSRKFSAISEALKEFPEIQLVFDVATKSPLKPEGVSAFVRYLPYSGAR